MIKLSLLRDSNDGCPFNLPIPLGCANVGEFIHNMKPYKDNYQKFILQSNGKKCPFAEKIIKNVVDCSYEEENKNGIINASPLFEKTMSGSGASGVNTMPHVYYSGDGPLSKGPFYDMYGIEMVASESDKSK